MRGDVRARAAPRGRRDHARARRPGRRVQPRLPLPEGHRAQAARSRPRPAAPPADPHRRHVARRHLGRGVRRDRARPRPDPRRARTATRSACTSATRTRTTSARILYDRVLLQALGTKNVFSASTVDQMPKQVWAGLMFGGALTVPVPDLDRTDYLLILGANPFASNGSLMTAPDVPGRLRGAPGRAAARSSSSTRAARRPPRKPTSTCFIRPGTDAHFLFGIVQRALRRRPRQPRRVRRVTSTGSTRSRGSRRLRARGRRAGLRHRRRRRSAASRATSRRTERAAVYGRIGTCTQEFGTLASWLVDVVNVLTGNLDREGGAMFTLPATGGANAARRRRRPGVGRGVRFGRRHEPGARPARVLRRAARSSRSPRRSRRRATARSAR